MDEKVFFNPGDAIANAHDFGEAMRSAQIYRAKDPLEAPLIIAKDAKNNKSFAVYFEKDNAQTKKDASIIEYDVVDRI
ncbi:hypothetical protein Q2T76_06775 [Lactobacillus sp. YT155]|uniref:hypothetical protein n=1 Tax=Lactobacillus sp. YT155 TaxID=3060955 RepID=UPI00265FE9A5|nr:hypothetical protein [Lactobacillus sp. YT155]MDO1605760.1 hypothetical protein [Lactobacillus sp. YT155]